MDRDSQQRKVKDMATREAESTNDTPAEPAKRTRGPTTRRKRSFSRELAVLESKVALALLVLTQVSADQDAVTKKLVDVAKNILRGVEG